MANVLHQDYNYNTRAAGLSTSHALVPVTPVLVHWADMIVCAEDWMEEEIRTSFETFLGDDDAVVLSLGLPDRFSWHDEELVETIRERFKEMTAPLKEDGTPEQDESDPSPNSL